MKYILINLLLSVWVLNSNINLIRGQLVSDLVNTAGSLLGGDSNTGSVCGIPNDIEPAEGLDPVLIRYPWISRLLNRGFFACAVTKVSDNAFITAAGCVYRINKTNLMVQSGIFDPNNATSQLVENRVTKIRVHPNYKPQTKENDIAVIFIAGSTPFNPVCIPEGDEEQYVGVSATVISSENVKNSDAYRAEEVTVMPISTTDCKLKTKYDPQDITFTMLCAPYQAEDTDACLGIPRGGPLHFLEDNRQKVIGLVSFRNGLCEETDYPQVYTRITNYVKFIRANI